ncbi:MAG: YciI family protein [Fimbriimonas sp.]
MKSIVLISCLVMTSAMAHASAERLVWGFLVKGTATRPDNATVERMQTAHIDNFKRLFGLGKLLTAGPVQDPTTVRRGIVILTPGKPAELKERFLPDPYVQSGLMNLVLTEVDVQFGKIQTSGIDPDGIVENRLVIFVRKEGSRSRRREHLNCLRKNGAGANLAFLATARKQADFDSVALFRGTDDAQIEALLAKDPAVASGDLTVVKMPQWLSKGILGG